MTYNLCTHKYNSFVFFGLVTCLLVLFMWYFSVNSLLGAAPDAQPTHPGMHRRVSCLMGTHIVMLRQHSWDTCFTWNSVLLQSASLQVPVMFYSTFAACCYCDCQHYYTLVIQGLQHLAENWHFNHVSEMKQKLYRISENKGFSEFWTFLNRLLFLDWHQNQKRWLCHFF